MVYKRLLLVSLAINVCLGVTLILQQRGTRSTISTEEASLRSVSNTPAYKVEAIQSTSRPIGWESVEAPDYQQYIKNLRAIGCPEETIRDIIEADVLKLYEEKKKQVRSEAPKFEYWKGDAFVRGSGREAWVKMHALDEERDKVMRELGVEPNYRKRALKDQNAKDWMLDFLGDAKKTEILRRQREFENKMATRVGNAMDVNEIKRLQDEHATAIKQLLTPEEALQYDLRMSPVAAMLRNELRGMDSTEQEFINLYKLRAAHEDQLQAIDPNVSGAERRGAEKLANEKFDEQIKEALGSERYIDYQMVRDVRYQNAYTFAQQAGLGIKETKQLYGLVIEAERAALQIRTSPDVPSEKRLEALQAIWRETEATMQSMLGERAWEQYKRGAHPAFLSRLGLPEGN